MSRMFEEARLGALTLDNRFIRSATYEGMAAEDGTTTKGLNALMRHLATGGVGLIITGHTFVLQEGRAGGRQLGIHDDAMIEGLKNMTAGVHEAGGKICLQLAHGGVHAALPEGETPLGPSAEDGKGKTRGKAMTEEDIRRTVGAFADGARRAKDAGFDAVQIHAAHGYLLSEFLSPFYNHRDDEWGGSRENRERLLMEVYAAVRSAVGADFPVLVKINAHDYMMGVDACFEDEDMVSACSRLAKAGIDGIELSGGTIFDSGKFSPSRMGMIREAREGFFRKPAKRLRDAVDVPLILVGGIRSFEKAEGFVTDGLCDFISMSRPLICEPDLINRWKSGGRSKAACMSDNMCFKPLAAGEGVYCVLNKKKKSRERVECAEDVC